MLRISVLVTILIIVSQISGSSAETMGSLFAYKDYLIALLLSMLIKPWVTDQFD